MQPMVVYPNSVPQHPPPSSSKGSFVPVFVALAIIAVLTAMACLIGQICARRYLRPRHRRDHAPYQSDGDIEGGIGATGTTTNAGAAHFKHGETNGGIKEEAKHPPGVGDHGMNYSH